MIHKVWNFFIKEVKILSIITTISSANKLTFLTDDIKKPDITIFYNFSIISDEKGKKREFMKKEGNNNKNFENRKNILPNVRK